MKTESLKLNFHQLIDKIENIKILETFYILLKEFNNRKVKIDFWDNFTDEQRIELEEAWEESEKEENLISHKTVMKESKKWLRK